MSEEARREWLAVAWESLKHLPPDLLSRGCKVARQTCDHPSKIVPAVIAATEDSVKYRARLDLDCPPALPTPTKRSLMDRRGEAMTEAETAELNSILESLGATARYRPDGTRYTINAEPSRSMEP